MRVTFDWWNDAFTAQHTDDNGFTNDLALSLDDGTNALRLRQRMITERGGPARIDENDAQLAHHQSWQHDQWQLGAELNAGVVVAGNTGAAVEQNWFHHLPLIHGRFIGRGLQDQYAGGLRTAPTLGGAASAAYTFVPALSVYSQVTAQVAPLTTGLSFINDEVGVRVQAGPIAASAGVLAECRTSNDRRLGLSGGYALGKCSLAPVAAVEASIGAFSLAWRLHMNEGGGGQATAAIELGFAL